MRQVVLEKDDKTIALSEVMSDRIYLRFATGCQPALLTLSPAGTWFWSGLYSSRSLVGSQHPGTIEAIRHELEVNHQVLEFRTIKELIRYLADNF